MSGTITYSTATGADLERIVNNMESMLVGEREDHVMMACLALVLAIQCPGITPEQMVQGIKSVSETVSLFAASIDGPPRTGEMN